MGHFYEGNPPRPPYQGGIRGHFYEDNPLPPYQGVSEGIALL